MTDDNVPQKFLTLAEAALVLRVGKRSLQRWIAQGVFPAVRLPGRRIRIPAAVIDGMERDAMAAALTVCACTIGSTPAEAS